MPTKMEAHIRLSRDSKAAAISAILQGEQASEHAQQETIK